ncbi:MAG: branched-chain amino acid transporter, ATP-binding protein, partial [Verrucomicrobiaceae bacterium]|nr:branched-chain amino acid transporter, ATP-binding protein [Verrucomicrobiaceae bacterium]
NPSIYEGLTVMENLELSHPKGRGLFACLAFRRSPEITAEIESVARDIGLNNHLDTEASILSHGQKQWLEIGMLLMQSPELIMLDEPVAGMSVKERSETAKLIKKIAQNRSVVVIEHDMEFVKEIADRVTVMHMGHVLAEGSMEDVQKDAKVIEVYIGH